MANSPHLCEDVRLINKGKQVDGIGTGLEIEGTGTCVMRISDNDRKTHKIKIPNSLYLPKVEAVPPVTATLGAGGEGKKGKQGQDMDGELLG
jgi:hypothetical protein